MAYQCPDCPYVYNEEAGDPDNGISPVPSWKICQPAGFVLSVEQSKQVSNNKNDLSLQG